MPGWTRPRGGGFVVAAFVLALGGALVVIFAPLMSWADSEGGSGSSSLFGDIRSGEEDLAPVVFLGIAVALPILALLALGTRADAPTRGVTAILLLVLCLLGAMSVGMFLLPAALALLVGAIRAPGRARGGGAAAARPG